METSSKKCIVFLLLKVFSDNVVVREANVKVYEVVFLCKSKMMGMRHFWKHLAKYLESNKVN